jgi:hypothetical protein
LVAGGIFKATTYMANIFTPGGILALFIRLMWMWGATGAMLSLAGILGKMTITTTADAIGQLMKAVQGIVTTAALAATGVGAVGAVGGVAGGAAGAGAAGGAAGGAEAAGLGAGAGAAGLEAGGAEGAAGAGLANASSHLAAAQSWSNRGALMEAFGLHRPAQFARALSGSHSIAARREELASRMNKFTGGGGEGASFDDVGFTVSSGVREQILDGYGGSPESFRQAYQNLAPLLESRGHTPSAFATGAPYQAGLMARIYSSERDSIDQMRDPLAEVISRAGLSPDLVGPQQ